MATQKHANATTHLALYVLGPLRIERAGAPVRIPTRKIESLLCLLALEPEPHAREKLAALFWGDVSDEQARGSLRKALTLLRKAMGDEILVADRQTVQLNPDFSWYLDAQEFERATQSMKWSGVSELDLAVNELETLYRGDLLPDLYDDWVLQRRQEYREKFLLAMLGLIQGYRSFSEYARAISLGKRVLQMDPANERVYQHLMFCYVGLGDRHGALLQYQECARALESELGVEPSSETKALFEWTRQFTGERAPGSALATNLPIPLSSFIGRRDEMTALKQYLKSARLVTLFGPGGSGKTRLAIQTASDLIDAFRDGVWWVELASITAAENVIQQIGKTLGIRPDAREEMPEAAQMFLQSKQLLLVLDNCEHVLEASAQIVYALLGAAPQVVILTTSREALAIPGEQVIPVPTLHVPQREGWSYVDLLREFDGIRLFVERAQATLPTFELVEENASDVAQICARLDGIPLALELAATRVNLLTPREIATRLSARFELLKDANRAAPPRHQTLRAVLDWSCELLSESERELFRRISVFSGGCTFESLCAVASDMERQEVFDLLARLVAKSLVITSQQGQITRYGMLETIREYAKEQLEASGEAEEIYERHLAEFVRMARHAEIMLRGQEQLQWLSLLDCELDNIRTALDWAVKHAPLAGLKLAGSLEWYWNLRGHWSESAMRFGEVLAAANSQASSPEYARALVAASALRYWGEQDHETVRDWLESAIKVYRGHAIPDGWNLAYALTLYGALLNHQGNERGASAALDESLELSLQVGDAGKWVAAWAHLFMGWVRDELPMRHAEFKASIGLFREIGDKLQLPVALAHYAWFCMGQGDLHTANLQAVEGMILTRDVGDALGAAWYEMLFGDLAKAGGESDKAAEHYRASYEQFQKLGNRKGMDEAREHLEELKSARAV